MALKDVAPVLAKDLVFVRIDTDRMVGGENLLKRLNNGKNDGIPWFALLDSDGKTVAVSNHPKDGNIGYPGEEPGATFFGEMLQKVAKRMTRDEIAALVKSAVAFRDAKLPPS